MTAKWTIDDVPGQQGRLAVVTGANTGLGFETAPVLAARGAPELVACALATGGPDNRGFLPLLWGPPSVTSPTPRRWSEDSYCPAALPVLCRRRLQSLLCSGPARPALPPARTGRWRERAAATEAVGVGDG